MSIKTEARANSVDTDIKGEDQSEVPVLWKLQFPLPLFIKPDINKMGSSIGSWWSMIVRIESDYVQEPNRIYLDMSVLPFEV